MKPLSAYLWPAVLLMSLTAFGLAVAISLGAGWLERDAAPPVAGDHASVDRVSGTTGRSTQTAVLYSEL